MEVKKRLEQMVKRYSVPSAIVALEVPLHEGVHAGLAKLLPGVGCSEVVLNNKLWYAYPLQTLTLGFYDAQALDPHRGGYAVISHAGGFISHMSGAITAAGPEVASMALGFYWLGRAIDDIKERGSRVYSIFSAFCGSVLVNAGFQYATSSSFGNGIEGADHVGFTREILKAFHLPGGIAPYLAVVGAGTMVAGSLHIANYFRNGKETKQKKEGGFTWQRIGLGK